jgi:hypothetical protein
MVRLPWLLPAALLALTACTKTDRENARTPLPTRQTTVDPVNSKLDAAAREGDKRREDVDNAAK